MSNPSRNRNLLFIIVALLLTNIAVLAYFLWIKQPEKRDRSQDNRPKIDMVDRLRDSVGFNDEQVTQFKKLKDEHWATLKPMFDDMRKAKDSLFRLVSDPNANDSVIDKVSDVIAQKQKALDLQTFNHFKKVRALCRPEQQEKYDSLVQRMFRKMGKPMRRSDKEKDEKK
jgi:Spy/CpxP family protein refolding chaperone